MGRYQGNEQHGILYPPCSLTQTWVTEKSHPELPHHSSAWRKHQEPLKIYQSRSVQHGKRHNSTQQRKQLSPACTNRCNQQLWGLLASNFDLPNPGQGKWFDMVRHGSTTEGPESSVKDFPSSKGSSNFTCPRREEEANPVSCIKSPLRLACHCMSTPNKANEYNISIDIDRYR